MEEEETQGLEQLMRYAVRPMLPEDADQVSAIEREAFPETWPPTSFHRELRNRLARHLVVWDTQASPAQAPAEEPGPQGWWPGSLPLIGRLFHHHDPPPRSMDYTVGYVSLWFMVDEAHITGIAVRSSHQGLGNGELLLIASVEMAVLRGSIRLTLETRVSNTTAQNLYEKYGFTTVGRRKRYYSDNKEDAFVMSTEDISSPSFTELFDRLRTNHSERWGVSSRYIT